MKTATARIQPWEALESGATAWERFSPPEQEAVVRHYAPKIRFLALRLKAKLPRSVELGELISSGTLGLMEALGKFRPQLGIRFETYAESRIRGAMLDELRRLDWVPPFPAAAGARAGRGHAAGENLEGRPATEKNCNTITALELREVRQGLEARRTSCGFRWTPSRTPLRATHRAAKANPIGARPCGNWWNASRRLLIP